MDTAAGWWRRLAATDPRILDLALVAGLAVATIADWALGTHPLWSLPFGLVIAGSIAVRRRYPLIGFAAAIVAGVGFRLGPEGFLALAVDAYSVGAYSKARWRALLVLLAGGVTLFGEWSAFLIIVMAWLVGDTIRDRRAAEAALERERAAGDRGALEERARIARDLHDVVAHAVSVIVVQAEAARNMLHRDPALAAESIDAISFSGREALGELRQLLHVLGSTDTTVPLAPTPTVSDIDQLVERLRAAGHPLELQVDGRARPLEPALSQTAYRVVQEALTNAIRYAAGAHTRVVVAYGRDWLTLEIVDQGAQNGGPPLPGSGYGLRGLRERVAIFGGELIAAPVADGGFMVRATLPLTGQ